MKDTPHSLESVLGDMSDKIFINYFLMRNYNYIQRDGPITVAVIKHLRGIFLFDVQLVGLRPLECAHP